MNARSAWLAPTGQTREDTRLTQIGATTPANPLQGRSGILPGSYDGQYRVGGFWLENTSAMTADVHGGRALVQGLSSQGAYPVTLPEKIGLTFADGDAQYTRIDLVCLRIYDELYDASGRSEAVVEIVQGTPAAVPAAPAVPSLALPLYEVTVHAGASAGNGGINWATALQDRRTTTVALGGIVPVYGDAANGAYPGQYRDANGKLERWDGNSWKQYPAVPAWQNWTPVWTTSTGNGTPSFGNATVNCRYIQTGPTVHLTFKIQFGGTTDFGSGATDADNWRFTLPVPAASTNECIGFAELGHNNNERTMARILCPGTGYFELMISSGQPNATAVSAGYVDAVSPWTWESPNAIRGTATYEAAV